MKNNDFTVDAVIFDVDGTLLDTSEGLLAAVKDTLTICHFAPLSSQELLTFIGPPIQDSLSRYYNISSNDIQHAAEIFRALYKEKYLMKAIPYNGIYEVMSILIQNNIKIGIATYKREDYALQILEYFHFDEYASVMHGADNYNQMKKKDIIQLCIEEMGLTASERIIMVGDSGNDAIGAENVGASFIGVTYGFGFKAEKDMQIYRNIGIAQTPQELLKILSIG